MIRKKTHRVNIDEFFVQILSVIQIVSSDVFSAHIEFIKTITPDPNDAAYLALAYHLGCPLWSEDKALRDQEVVEVVSTSKLLKK